jgi:hypothetical protein
VTRRRVTPLESLLERLADAGVDRVAVAAANDEEEQDHGPQKRLFCTENLGPSSPVEPDGHRQRETQKTPPKRGFPGEVHAETRVQRGGLT